MVSKLVFDPNRRKKLRRLALVAFLAFCTVSAVLHFTVGSLIAMLFPGQAPPPVVADQAVSILTIYRLAPERQKPITPTEQQQIAMRDVTRIDPIKKRDITRTAHTMNTPDSSSPAAFNAPSRKNSMPHSSAPKQQKSSPQAAVAALAAPLGSGPANPRTSSSTGNGATGNAGYEDMSLPGRPIPTGAVWTDNGPPGQSESAGGVLLGGGSGGGGGSGVHDSCTPSRGGFF